MNYDLFGGQGSTARKRKRSVPVPGFINGEIETWDELRLGTNYGSEAVRLTCSYSRMIAEVAGEVEIPTLSIEDEESSSDTVGIGSFAGNYEMTIHTPDDVGGLINYTSHQKVIFRAFIQILR